MTGHEKKSAARKPPWRPKIFNPKVNYYTLGAMNIADIAGMGLVGVLGGLIVFVVLHWNVKPAQRAKVVRWCLSVGVISVAFFIGHWLLGLEAMSPRALLGFGFVGLPIFVGGVLLAVAGMLRSKEVQ